MASNNKKSTFKFNDLFTKEFYKNHKRELKHILFCIIGSFLVAFGTACFLIPAEVVAGGTSGIGMILNHFLKDAFGTRTEDIIVWTINIVLLIVAYFFVGKRFALNTLVSTIFFPLFLTLMLRTNMITWLSDYFKKDSEAWKDMEYYISLRLLLAGIFAGITIGIGVSITFIGYGSTGGFDVLYFLIEKYLHIKQSISSFVLDGLTILVYALVVPNHVIPSLVGVVSAMLSAVMIEVMYIKLNTNYVVDILTNKYKEINNYIIKELGATSTLLDATGAYSKKEFKLVRFVLPRRKYEEIRKELVALDPKAFISVVDSKEIIGKGFKEIKLK